mgnify:CR=1 FL=1
MIDTIVFDIGNVLVRWDPHAAFAPHLGGPDAVPAFLERIGFRALNLRADGGETFADLAATIPDAGDRALFLTYLDGHAASIREPIEESWALMERLRARGHAIHAITNWSAETWPIGLATHPRLARAFGVTVVSGIEGVAKPGPEIFARLCAKAGVAPGQCLFIDDSAANVAGARAAGMEAHHFIDAAGLERDLSARGLL